MNVAAILLNNANNWLIQNPTINGNAANQVISGLGPNGIEMTMSSNCCVDGAYIYNCRQFGFYPQYNVVRCGIANSKITNCGWNGILLGGGGGGENELYAINNEVAYSGDVGISSYSNSSTIQNNYVHDINGTTGGGGNSHMGIASESGGNDTISNNTVVSCDFGITISTGSLNTISGNTVQATNLEAVTLDTSSSSNLVEGNIISQWDMSNTWHYAVLIRGSNNIISDNVMSDTNPYSMGFDITGINNYVSGGSIVCQQPAFGWALMPAGTKVYNVGGYNPVGYIANPFSASLKNIYDTLGDNATLTSGWTYTNIGSPKTLYITGGTVTVIAQNGQTLASTTMQLNLQPGDTFSVTFSTAPTINVVGQ
jgi:parallel beta-helix repeat protein